MHLARALRFILIAGAFIGSGRRSGGAWRAAATPGGTGPPRAVSAAVPPPDRRPDPPPNADTPFLDLVADGTIAVTARGATRRRVALTIENRDGRELTIAIPIGTFFEAEKTTVPSMIATYGCTISVEPYGTRTKEIQAACARPALLTPLPCHAFGAIRDPPDPRLAAALRALDRHGASRHARQAAVYIMASDARWDAFGTRISREGQVRLASEDETALAMLAVHLSGLEITSTAIWEDAPAILAGVVDPDLKAWLESRC